MLQALYGAEIGRSLAFSALQGLLKEPVEHREDHAGKAVGQDARGQAPGEQAIHAIGTDHLLSDAHIRALGGLPVRLEHPQRVGDRVGAHLGSLF